MMARAGDRPLQKQNKNKAKARAASEGGPYKSTTKTKPEQKRSQTKAET
jgi:hypothetical protein